MGAAEGLERFYPVLLAGGPGSRLWPLSREDHPKFLLDLLGTGRSLLQVTHDRFAALAPASNLRVVAGRSHAAEIARQLQGLDPDSILVEPESRGSLPAMLFAAHLVHDQDELATLGFFPCDQLVHDVQAFEASVRRGHDLAARTSGLVTLAVQPTRPSTAFGYVRMSGRADADPGLVEQFVEKPNAALAQEFFDSGSHLWNTGMFMARARDLIELAREYVPGLVGPVRAAAEARLAREQPAEGCWAGLEHVAIDRAIAEPAASTGRVYADRAQFDWDDVGDWGALPPHVSGRPLGRTVVVGHPDRVVALETKGGIVVNGTGRVIALSNVDDIVVVDTPDALLVTRSGAAQEVSAIVRELRGRGLGDVL